MSLIHYTPWNLHRDLVNDFSRFLDRSPGDDSSGATADWAPPVDIEEYPDRFVIYADVPGVDPASIDVTLDEGCSRCPATVRRRTSRSISSAVVASGLPGAFTGASRCPTRPMPRP